MEGIAGSIVVPLQRVGLLVPHSENYSYIATCYCACKGGGEKIYRCLYMYKFVGYPILNKVYFSEVVFSLMFYS